MFDRKVTATAREVQGGSRVGVLATPATPGATAVLQVYLKDHFGWWPVAQKRLDKHSRTTFELLHKRRVRARVVLRLRDGATVIAVGPVLKLTNT